MCASTSRSQRLAGSGLRADLAGKLRHRPRLHQGGANAVANEVMDERLLAEANLSLGGMNVNIHLARRHLQEKQHHRKNGRRNDVAISLSQRALNQPVAYQSVVHKNKDGIAIQLLQLRLAYKTMDAQLSRLRLGVILIAPPWRRLR